MRVAMIIQSFPPVLGGAQRQVQRLAPLLERRGADVRVVTRRWEPAPVRERMPGLRLLRIPAPRTGALGSLVWSAGGMLAASALRPDVIHAHDLMSPTSIAVACSRRVGAPVVAKVLSTGVDGDIDRLLRKPLGRRRVNHVAERVNAFVSLSGEVEAELRGYGVAAERVHDIPNGVDAGHFRPARDAGERTAVRRALGIPDDAVVTLYCGRLRDVKRLDVLVDAFRQIPGHLVMVGDGPEEQALRASARAPELAGRVHLLNTVDEPAPYYRAADIYASASQTEGMSGSVLEAMATGLAIAASPASGMQELIGGGAGLIADDLSAQALATVLSDAARDAELRARLGDAARRRAIERYSLEATADRLMALYRTLTVAA